MSIITTMNKQEDLQSKANRPLVDIYGPHSEQDLGGAAARQWICGLGLGLFENVLRRGAGDLRLTNGITGSSDAGIPHEQIDRHDITFPHSIVAVINALTIGSQILSLKNVKPAEN